METHKKYLNETVVGNVIEKKIEDLKNTQYTIAKIRLSAKREYEKDLRNVEQNIEKAIKSLEIVFKEMNI